MKTVDEKALDLITAWESGNYIGGEVQKRAALQCAIIHALKVQDRDTRHACAEAIHNLPEHSRETDSDGNTWVGMDAASAACMNVKAV